jgi:hypothetical protein
MAVTRPRLRVLLLCDDNPSNANTLLDHIKSFGMYSRHKIKRFNPRWAERSRTLDFNEFDVVVVHWSLSLIHDHYLHTSFRDRLARFGGLKVQFVQDDYRWVDRMTAEQRRVGINVLFTLVSPENFDKIWTPRLPGVRLVSTLPGYVPGELLDRPYKPIAGRELDIVYRGREVPWWLGRLGQDKVLIGHGVKARAGGAGLKVDIAWTEADRIYGDRWNDFLGNSRTTIGCEGGASISDFDGSIEQAVVDYVKSHPGATFEDVHSAILAPYEGNVPLNVMTPRLFEAAALRTALVLFPGQYSGVLEPWRHYIPLEKDFSNFDAVAHLIKDDQYLTELTQRTYDEVAKAPRSSLQGMVAEFDGIIDEEGLRRARRPMVGYGMTVAQSRTSNFIRTRSAALPAGVVRWRPRSQVPVRPAARLKQAAAKGYVALRATSRSRYRVALLWRSVMARSRTGAPRMAVALQEIVKLDILCRARSGRLTAGDTFQTSPVLLPDGVLELRSVVAGERDPDSADGAEVLRALHDGEVDSLVWNHSAIASSVYHAWWRRRWIPIWVGPDGRYEFLSIKSLLQSNRDLAIRIIEPALSQAGPAHEVTEPSSRRSSSLPSELPRHVRRLAKDPLGYLVRVWIMARVIAPNSAYRSVVARHLFEPRLRSVRQINAVVGDLLRLDALTRLCKSGGGLTVRLDRDPDGGHWLYVSGVDLSMPMSSREPMPADAPVSVSWDHSAVSSSLSIPAGIGMAVKVSLGATGVYAFETIGALAQSQPGLLRSILPIPVAQAHTAGAGSVAPPITA